MKMGCGDIHGLYVNCIIVSSFEKIKFVIFKKDLPCTTKVTVSVVKGAALLSLNYISFHVGLILGIVKKGSMDLVYGWGSRIRFIF